MTKNFRYTKFGDILRITMERPSDVAVAWDAPRRRGMSWTGRVKSGVESLRKWFPDTHAAGRKIIT